MRLWQGQPHKAEATYLRQEKDQLRIPRNAITLTFSKVKVIDYYAEDNLNCH